MRMRTTLLLCLLSVSFGVAVLSLLIVHSILEKQIRQDISSDLRHSMQTFQNIQVQRQEMLRREAALLADLPSLKSLMTTEDGPTIRDGGVEFYSVSGSDFFALADRSGKLMALYENGAAWNGTENVPEISSSVFTSNEPQYVLRSGRLYEVSAEPLFFGSPLTGTHLGYVAVGYAINDRLAREVSEVAAAEVVFSADGAIVATTLDSKRQQECAECREVLGHKPANGADIWLGHEHYVQALVKLSSAGGPLVQLGVLKSYDQASQYLIRLNHLLIAFGAFILLIGGALALYVSGTITRPLEALVAGARALGSGDFNYEFYDAGAREIRELSSAFDRMCIRLQKTQQKLLEAERLATIGRMASSISHDLRHYLSAVYANAEFLGYSSTSAQDRAELLAEVRLGVQGMTELIDSLLLFSRTGRPLQLTYESLPFLAERASLMVRAHPDAQDVAVTWGPMPQIEAWIDALKIERAIYNLLLNGCQAAKSGTEPSTVNISLLETEEWIKLRVTDNGPGVPDSIRVSLFQPFVSEGKQSGVGLGLTLAYKIAQEHGGSVTLEESRPGRTVFSLLLGKAALRDFAKAAQQPHAATLVSHS